jgi:hypothetical protein
MSIDESDTAYPTDAAANYFDRSRDPADVDALTASTDGWAAALQLATLSLRPSARVSKTPRPSGGSPACDWTGKARRCRRCGGLGGSLYPLTHADELKLNLPGGPCDR